MNDVAPPLAGRRVVVTRSRSQASTLVEGLAGAGATVIELPVIELAEPTDGGAGLAAAAARSLDGAYDWVACTSRNTVARLLAVLDGRRPPPGTRWAAVGPGTAAALDGAGFAPDLVPATATAAGLVGVFPDAPEPGGVVLFPRAAEVSGTLVDGLRSKGWRVDEVVAYRTARGTPGPEAIADARRADAVAFTSSSTVRRTVELLGIAGVPKVVVSIGPVTTAAARAAGLVVAAEADQPTIAGLVAATVLATVGPPAPGDPVGPPGRR